MAFPGKKFISPAEYGNGRAPAGWKIPFITALLGFLCLLIISYGSYSGSRINTVDARLVQAAMKIKLESVTTDILLAALLDGSVVVGLETVWAPLEASVKDFCVQLEQNASIAQWPPYVAMPVEAKDAEILKAQLHALKAEAERRLTLPRHQLIDGPESKMYRGEFKRFISLVDHLEAQLRLAMTANLARFKTSQAAMIVLGALLTLAASITLRRIDLHRANAYRELQNAGVQLSREVTRRARLLAELKDYSYAISHDLRAPLIGIKGFCSEIRFGLDELRSQLNAAGHQCIPAGRNGISAILEHDLPEALGYLDAAAARMSRLLEAILKLSRCGRRRMVAEPLRTGLIVAEALKLLAYQIKSRNIEVTLADLPDLTADREALEQVFANLLNNAVNYLDPQRPGRIRISGESRPGESIFRVSDNGRGIRADAIEKIFNMFERLGENGVPGEGMGLCYVRTLVRRHGGEVHCESRPGVGSTFTFSIPRQLTVDDEYTPGTCTTGQPPRWRCGGESASKEEKYG